MSDEQKEQREKELETRKAAADAENATRSGVGTRKRVGQTRGRSSNIVEWEAFDREKPDTLPKAIPEFMTVTGVNQESDLVSFLIDGYNDYQYEQASDPIGDFVVDSWPAAHKAAFRIAVRNYAKAVQVSIEDAVTLIKPGFEKAAAVAGQ